MIWYWQRYCLQALADIDYEKLAIVHHCRGRYDAAYMRRFRQALKEASYEIQD
jgi:hypothetical protein